MVYNMQKNAQKHGVRIIWQRTSYTSNYLAKMATCRSNVICVRMVMQKCSVKVVLAFSVVFVQKCIVNTLM